MLPFYRTLEKITYFSSITLFFSAHYYPVQALFAFLIPKQNGQLWQAWRAIKTGQLGFKITAAELCTSDGSQSPPNLVCNKLVHNSSAAWKLLSKSCILQSHTVTQNYPLVAFQNPRRERALCHTAQRLQKLSLGAHSGFTIGTRDDFVSQMQEWEAFGCQEWHYFWDRVRKRKPHPWRSQTDST